LAPLLYRCYAKVNLTLEVLGKRADGYHNLASLVHTISLADDLRLERADELLTRVEGLDIDPDTNLVARAAQRFASATDSNLGAELSLVKHIPAAAGLGGGSADAAATLVGLNTLWSTRKSLSELGQVAAELGADVPFFLRGGAALMTGRGEDLRPLPPMAGQWLVLVVAAHDLVDKTRRLYSILESSDFSSGEASMLAARRLEQRLPLAEDQLTNAFERAAKEVFPGLGDAWSAVERLSERRYFLSGAGPAIFAFASDRTDARSQTQRVASLGLAAFAVRTVKHARTAIKFADKSTIGTTMHGVRSVKGTR
jgi:4-diphosphocytidyl-2-C-methyl-D-erythritol kinase